MTSDYLLTICFGVLVPSLSILLVASFFVLPGPLDYVILIAGIALLLVVGFPALCCARDTRRARLSIPKYYREGQIVGDPMEHQNP
jgi:hypothetical protein